VAKKTSLTPQVWDYSSSLMTLQSHYLPQQAPTYSVQYTIPPYTNYTQKQLVACQ